MQRLYSRLQLRQLLRDRQILLRDESGIRSFFITRGHQITALSVCGVLFAWCLTATLGWGLTLGDVRQYQGMVVSLLRDHAEAMPLLADTAQSDVILVGAADPTPEAVARRKATLRALVEENARIEAELRTARAELAETSRRSSALMAENAQLAAARASLESTLQTRDREVAHLGGTLAETEERLSRAEGQLQATAGALDAAGSAADTADPLARRVALLTEARDRAEAAAAAGAAELARVRGTLAATQMALVDTETRLAVTRAAHDGLLADSQEWLTRRTQMQEALDLRDQRIAGLMELNKTLAAEAVQKAEARIERIRHAFATTGLDAERLLAGREEDATAEDGQGGPFIPLPDNADALIDSDLGSAIETLGERRAEMARLSGLMQTLPFAAPLDIYRIASRFGRRADPINRRMAIHEGVDLVNALKTPVKVTAPGRVTFAGWQRGYGRLVEIDHGAGISTRYGHLDSIAVKKGQDLVADAVLGRLGNSGRSTGPHLHYEIRIGGKPKDPLRFIQAGAHVHKK